VQRHPKTFDLVKVRVKSVEIWAKCVKTFAKSLHVLSFYKNGIQNQSADAIFWRSCFYVIIFGNARGKFGQKRCLKCALIS